MKEVTAYITIDNSTVYVIDLENELNTSYPLNEFTYTELNTAIKGKVAVILNSTNDLVVQHTVPKMPKNKIKSYMKSVLPSILNVDLDSYKYSYNMEGDVATITAFYCPPEIDNIIKAFSSKTAYIVSLLDIVRDYTKKENLITTIVPNSDVMACILTKNGSAVYNTTNLLFSDDNHTSMAKEFIRESFLFSRKEYRGAILDKITVFDLEGQDITIDLDDIAIYAEFGIKKPDIECISYTTVLQGFTESKKLSFIGHLKMFTGLDPIDNIILTYGKYALISVLALLAVLVTIAVFLKIYTAKSNVSQLKSDESMITEEINQIDNQLTAALNSEFNAIDATYRDKTADYINTPKVLEDLAKILPKDSKIKNVNISKDGTISLNVKYNFNAYNVSNIINSINNKGIFEPIVMEDIVLTKPISDINLKLKYK